ncbi:phycobilisome linker polypeptide [Leptolyngbyaceae cyanobacterium UHCC 1019]
MLGQLTSTGTASSSASNRIFVYEVEGLQQNDQTDNNQYPVRNSSTILLQVPYSRMNSEMQRISRLGGKIVSIYPLGEAPSAPPSEAPQV